MTEEDYYAVLSRYKLSFFFVKYEMIRNCLTISVAQGIVRSDQKEKFGKIRFDKS